MNDRYDRFEVRVSLTESCNQDEELTPRVHLISQVVLINGENLAPNHSIDMRLLAKSCQLSGEFFIVTCGCGVAGCANIEDGIRVSHFPDRIFWEVPDPISAGGISEKEYEQYCAKRKFRKYAFEPAAYLTAVQKGLRDARCKLFGEQQPVECSPYGFDPEELIDLDPIIFSERGAPLGCKIVGRKVSIAHTPGGIVINGIYYDLDELPVPESIKQLNDWSDWEPQPCGDGFAYNYAAAPNWEVRRRMKILGNHLSGITQRGGEITITLQEDYQSKRKHQLVLGGKAQ